MKRNDNDIAYRIQMRNDLFSTFDIADIYCAFIRGKSTKAVFNSLDLKSSVRAADQTCKVQFGLLNGGNRTFPACLSEITYMVIGNDQNIKPGIHIIVHIPFGLTKRIAKRRVVAFFPCGFSI